MTPEREARLRLDLASAIKCDVPNCHNYACVTAELLAELDRLRAAAEALGGEIGDKISRAKYMSFDKSEYASVLRRGRELGLWS